jgi:hypothetical protein
MHQVDRVAAAYRATFVAEAEGEDEGGGTTAATEEGIVTLTSETDASLHIAMNAVENATVTGATEIERVSEAGVHRPGGGLHQEGISATSEMHH